MVKKQAIDGVYCARRPELRSKLIEHVAHVVERLSRLEAMRGLAVVSAGRADDLMRDLVRLAHDRMDHESKTGLIANIDKRVAGAAGSHAKAYSKLTDIEGRLGSRALNSAILYETALLAVGGVSDAVPACKPGLEVLQTYLVEVIQPRNALGHIVETRDVDGWVISYANGRHLTKDGLTKMRKDLARHLDNFSNLANVLTAGGEA